MDYQNGEWHFCSDGKKEEDEMCCKRQKQGSRQAWYSWDTLKRKEINWGRTSAPLLFSNTFWVISSTNFWDDQNKYGANALCFSHSWNLICVKVLTFSQVSARKVKLKRCYQQPSFSGWKKDDLGLLWFTTRCFLSHHTWNGCVKLPRHSNAETPSIK